MVLLIVGSEASRPGGEQMSVRENRHAVRHHIIARLELGLEIAEPNVFVRAQEK